MVTLLGLGGGLGGLGALGEAGGGDLDVPPGSTPNTNRPSGMMPSCLGWKARIRVRSQDSDNLSPAEPVQPGPPDRAAQPLASVEVAGLQVAYRPEKLWTVGEGLMADASSPSSCVVSGRGVILWAGAEQGWGW